MFSGVGVICFAGSYLVAWTVELLCLRSGRNGWRAVVGAALFAGLVAQTAFLSHHFIFRNDHLVVSAAGWFYVLAWGLALMAFWLFFTAKKTPFPLFLLPAALLAIFAAHLLGRDDLPAAASAQTLRALHGGTLFGAVAALFFGFLTGCMFFLKSAKLRHPNALFPPIRLPSLERLEKALRFWVIFSTVLLGAGVVSGILLNSRRVAAEARPPMTDSLVVGASILFLLLAGALVIAWIGRFRSAKRTATLTIACFFALILILTAAIVNPNSHWRGERETPTTAEEPALNGGIALPAPALEPAENAQTAEGGTP